MVISACVTASGRRLSGRAERAGCTSRRCDWCSSLTLTAFLIYPQWSFSMFFSKLSFSLTLKMTWCFLKCFFFFLIFFSFWRGKNWEKLSIRPRVFCYFGLPITTTFFSCMSLIFPNFPHVQGVNGEELSWDFAFCSVYSFQIEHICLNVFSKALHSWSEYLPYAKDTACAVEGRKMKWEWHLMTFPRGGPLETLIWPDKIILLRGGL